MDFNRGKSRKKNMLVTFGIMGLVGLLLTTVYSGYLLEMTRGKNEGPIIYDAMQMNMDMGSNGQNNNIPHYFGPYPNYANSPQPGNSVIRWSKIALDTIQPKSSMPGMMSSVSMGEGLVLMSYVQAAIYDALVAIEGGYYPYNATMVTGDANASRDAAVASAAYSILTNFFPSANLNMEYNNSLNVIVDSPMKTAGITVGQNAAQGILYLRMNDGRKANNTYSILTPGAGIWQPTMTLPNGSFAPPIDPWLAVMKPFTLLSSSQFRPAAPPALNSTSWADQFNEVKSMGSKMSMARTPEQSEVALFWTDNGVIQYNDALRSKAFKKGLGLLDTARLLAMANIAGTDATIAVFDTKYNYSFWRPVTAIRNADLDGRNDTAQDANWMPYIMTPNHPEYAAGHGSLASAIAEVLTQYFGTDLIDLELYSDVTKTTHHFATAAELREEIVNARTWGGIHYRGSSQQGVSLGQNVTKYMVSNYFKAATSKSQHVETSGGMRKFVDSVAGLTSASANNLGNYISVAVPDTTTYPGCEYYEIAVIEFEQKMHSDLPPTLLRGYVQLETSLNYAKSNHIVLKNPDGTNITMPGGTQAVAVDKPMYLGATIVTKRDVPVRITFYNLLPTGTGGDLFLPVDTTVMGSGMGPYNYLSHVMVNNGGSGYTSAPTVTISGGGGMGATAIAIVVNGMVDSIEITNRGIGFTSEPIVTISGGNGTGASASTMIKTESYTQNRANLHLHGGVTPWISDGTPHQWITPAGEMTSYPKGVSVEYVPDMWFVNGSVVADTVGQVEPPVTGATTNPGDGAQTFYYTNQQSARLMFYHDHSYGITRLNVYAGEAAGYILTDQVETDLIMGTNVSGVNPDRLKVLPDLGIPLVIQDKTFVDAERISFQDPTWMWGSSPGTPQTGDLWMPHVYMPNQNPWDPSGMNAFGRWHYGPWFWPPTSNVAHGPVSNPYYDPVNNSIEPPMIPGVPSNSMAMEAFMDTPVVNGVAYPYMDVDAKAYRFRILSVGNDRFFNLQFYVADPEIVTSDGRTNTEVKMVPAEITPGFPADWPTDGRDGGVPDPSTAGPEFIQIGTEGGFLPKPVVIPNQPVTWNLDPTNFDFGNVDLHTLLLGPAERADVIVDFSQFSGKTLILYNDAPAAFPARDPRYDYYTGNLDYTENGGTPPTQPGYGPNIRTIMQFRVAPPKGIINLTEINVHNGGAYYSSPAVNVIGGGGSGATASAIGSVSKISINTVGSGYTSPIITLTGGGGSGATAKAKVLNGAIISIEVINGGSGYTTAPKVNITDPTGINAVAKATLTITDVMMASTGAGFTSIPVVVITDTLGSGSGALAIATMFDPNATAPYDLAALESVFAKNSTKRGVFEASQDPILVPQAEYNSAYDKVFPEDPYARIHDFDLTFKTVSGGTVTVPFEPKAIQDEMGEAFETDYGRMSGMLGLEQPQTAAGAQNFVLYSYPSPPVDLILDNLNAGEPEQGDGTQIWKITHNGVDTHTLHTHLFQMQLVNRVAWDDAIRVPDLNELGWKETVRVNPLQDTIVAIRPYAPTMPFEIPNSVRLIDPTQPEGAKLMGPPGGFFDPSAEMIVTNGEEGVILNHYVNFGWEYVMHCHLLGHEEMDMMHAVVFGTAPRAPSNLTAVLKQSGNNLVADLAWTDNSIAETHFTIERANDPNGPWSLIATMISPGGSTRGPMTYTDNTLKGNVANYYRVSASNVIGDTMVYEAPSIGFPTATMRSGFTNTATATPGAPGNLLATLGTGPKVTLSFTDNALGETGFLIQRAMDAGSFADLTSIGPINSAGNTGTYDDTTVLPGHTYHYRIASTSGGGVLSPYSNTASAIVPNVPTAPTSFFANSYRVGNSQNARVALNWTDTSNSETGFTIVRSTNSTFSSNLATTTVDSNVVTYTTGNLDRSTTYYFRIRSYNDSGTSAWVTVTVTTP